MVDRHKSKNSVVEKGGGRTIKSIFQQSNVESSSFCGLPCVVCSSGGKMCNV